MESLEPSALPKRPRLLSPSPRPSSFIPQPSSFIPQPSSLSSFTLIELLAVMAIMILILSMAAASSVQWGRAARIKNATQQALASVQSARQWALTHAVATQFIPVNDEVENRGACAIVSSSQGLIGTTNYFPAGLVWTNALTPVWFLPDGTVEGLDRELVISETSKGSANLAITVKVYRVTGNAELLP